MLASFVGEPERLTPAQLDRFCRDFDNWAIVDTMCFALFDRTPHAWGRVEAWSRKRGEFEKYIANLDELRSRTLEAAGNGVLADMLDSINDKTREIQRRIIILPGRAAEGLEQHRAVLAAMRKGDAAGAEELHRELEAVRPARMLGPLE